MGSHLPANIMSEQTLSLWCVFVLPAPAEPTRKICRQCGQAVASSQPVDRISRECPAADAIRPPQPPRNGRPGDWISSMVDNARRAWPECPLSDDELRALVLRCRGCARYSQEAGRCGRWNCRECVAKWADCLARGATCFEPR